MLPALTVGVAGLLLSEYVGGDLGSLIWNVTLFVVTFMIG